VGGLRLWYALHGRVEERVGAEVAEVGELEVACEENEVSHGRVGGVGVGGATMMSAVLSTQLDDGLRAWRRQFAQLRDAPSSHRLTGGAHKVWG
jgi:hypothetical protein